MTEFKPIPIPSSIADVTPDLCRSVFVGILGGTVDKKPTRWLEGKTICSDIRWRLNGQVFGSESFNLFKNIADTKLLDKWVVGNGFIMNVDLLRNGNWECRVFFSHNSGIGYVSRTAPTEEMARACAVLMAYNKLKEDK